MLGTQDPQAHLFAVTLPNDGNTPLVLLGVTPETLPIRHGDRLRLKPLAGSAPGRRAEVRRVLRPGGRLVMAEPDWDSLAIDHPDLGVSRAYTRHLTDRIVRNAVVGRQLQRLALQAGFAVTSVAPATSVFRDVHAADQVLGLQRNTERAVAAGYLTDRQADCRLDHLAKGPFFAAVTLYIVTAETPVTNSAP
ncbi:hypothetical protein [Streptomyces sp. cg2]|uniref:hypothetical protein n=1 Tax=Streptomyces sp. cg2 TaxID=3238799 RepID=UPI0034E280A4